MKPKNSRRQRSMVRYARRIEMEQRIQADLIEMDKQHRRKIIAKTVLIAGNVHFPFAQKGTTN